MWTDGAEYGTLHSHLYSATSASPPTNDTTAPPDGAYEYRFDLGESFRKDVYAANATRILYIHARFTVVTAVDQGNAIFHCSPPGTNPIALFLNTDNTLQLSVFIGGAWFSAGSASSALATGTVYRVEWKIDSIANVFAFKLEGTDVAGDQSVTIGDIGGSAGGIEIGLSTALGTVGQVRMDSLAINDDQGSFQNTWVGEQHVIHLHSDSAGDNTAWTPLAGNNWDNVEEVPSDDITTYNSETVLNDIDDYNYGASGLGSAVIDVVHVTDRWINPLFIGSAKHVLRIKASSGGTVEESAELPAVTIWTMLTGNTEPKLYPLTLYDLPGASATAWTAADLDTAQAGVRISTGGGVACRVSNLPIVVGYHSAVAARRRVGPALMSANAGYF